MQLPLYGLGVGEMSDRLRRWRWERRRRRLAQIDCPKGTRHAWRKLEPGDRVGEHEFLKARAWSWNGNFEYEAEGFLCERCQMTNVKIRQPGDSYAIEAAPTAIGYVGFEFK